MVHELTKGLYELSSLNPDFKDILRGEEVQDEAPDVLMGPGLFKRIMAMIPSDEQYLMLPVQRKLVLLPTVDAQEILRQTPKGKQIFNKLVNDARNENSEHQQNLSKYDEENKPNKE